MNLVKYHIIEVHEIKEIHGDYGTYILVDLTVNCYDDIRRTVMSFRDMDAWNTVLEKGYYLS